MSPIIQMENRIIVPSSFLFWLACAIHVATGYPSSFDPWVEALLWGAFLAPFAAGLVYGLREAIKCLGEMP